MCVREGVRVTTTQPQQLSAAARIIAGRGDQKWNAGEWEEV